MLDLTIPQIRRIIRPDAIIRGEEAGTGPTILLLHAGAERRQVWSAVIDVLVTSGFRCVAYDQRGHGESGGTPQALAPYVEDVAAMLEAEDPGCVVVGASLGGFAALAALANPVLRHRAAGLVLVDVVPDFDPGRVRAYLAELGIFAAHSAIVDDILARLPVLQRAAAALDLPVLLVRGGFRSPILDEEADRFRRLMPHAAVIRIAEAGHLIAREQPTALAEAIATTTAVWLQR